MKYDWFTTFKLSVEFLKCYDDGDYRVREFCRAAKKSVSAEGIF